MRIEHSPLLNDFLCFYMETKVDGELQYETVVYYSPKKYYCIQDLRDGGTEYFSFEDEATVESEIRSHVERMAAGGPMHSAC